MDRGNDLELKFYILFFSYSSIFNIIHVHFFIIQAIC
jgi:hypothetical protein